MRIWAGAPAPRDYGHTLEFCADQPSKTHAIGYRCPKCGLDIKIEQRQVGPILVYHQDEWQQRCQALHLGSPGHCIE
jgi:hypothetical protein